MMDAPAGGARNAADAGPRAPLRGLVAVAIETLRTRVDLAATEFEMHLLALVHVLVWALGAITCILVALAFAVTALVVSLWDTHRMLALLGSSGVFVVLAALFGWLGARTIRGKPGMLEGTLQQLRDDQRSAGRPS
jgi:uncharacterized membrane protein YqjE